MDYQHYSEDGGVDYFNLNAVLFLPDSIICKFLKNYMALKSLELENNILGSLRLECNLWEYSDCDTYSIVSKEF